MSDPVTESSVQKGIIPDTKPIDEAPRRADGVSQLCMYCQFARAHSVWDGDLTFLVFGRRRGKCLRSNPRRPSADRRGQRVVPDL